MAKMFKAYLQTEVKRIGKRECLSDAKAFLFWFATTILDLSDDDAREAISVEGANDKGIDLFWIDHDEGRIIIVQGKFSSSLESHPTVSQVTRLESSVNWLENPEALRRDGRSDLAQAAEDYLNATKSGYGVELWFVYTGPKCANVDKHISVYNQNQDNVNRRRVIRHYDVGILRDTWEELEGASRRIPSATVYTVGGRVLSFDGIFGKAIVASIPGAEIVRLYQENGERLFDRNVRLFLGARKGSVNAGIAETLKDKKKSQNFWAYNNGITVVCDKFTVNKSYSAIKLVNFSIVNGCQTAVSLVQNSKHVESTAVLVRFIAASPDILDDVILFTNSQNPIKAWDIASQDRTQRRLKTEFEQLEKPFIYLTRRGYRPSGDTLKKFRADGKLRQIRIDLIGQYAAAFRGNPVLAYAHKAHIFSPQYHDSVFPPDVQVQEVLFQWVCGEIARDAVREAMAEKKEDEVRILKKGGTLFVTAVLSKILSLRNGATYLTGATEQSITSQAMKKRLVKYAEYARNGYVQAVIDQSELDKEELATLIRQPEFHDKVIKRVVRHYEKDACAGKWLKEALPAITLRGK